MPKRQDISTILLIGSGPIVIGQACEFDYSGTQAAKTLKELGYKVILIKKGLPTGGAIAARSARRGLLRPVRDVLDEAHQDRRDLGAGGVALRVQPVLTVLAAAADHALGHDPLHGRAGVGADVACVRERGQLGVLRGIDAHLLRITVQDRRHLFARDAAVRLKFAVADAVDHAVLGRPRDRVGVPLPVRNVRESYEH